jgi:hypothetical protein
MSRLRYAANKGRARPVPFGNRVSIKLSSHLGQRRKHRLGSVGDHGKKGPRRPARHALALLPVANGLDGNTEPACEFQLGQAGAAAKIAYRGSRRRFRRRDRRPCRYGERRHRRSDLQRRSQGNFPPVSQFDDPSVRFQPQAPHVPPDFKFAIRDTNPEPPLRIAPPNCRRCALRPD